MFATVSDWVEFDENLALRDSFEIRLSNNTVIGTR